MKYTTILLLINLVTFRTNVWSQDTINNSKYPVIERFLDTLFKHYAIPLDTVLILNKAMESIAKSLDPHSIYLNAENLRKRDDVWAGVYEAGIGVSLDEINGMVYFSRVKDDLPAQKSGLLTGDMVLKIDSISTKGYTLLEVVNKLKGEPGTNVQITVSRGDSALNVSLVREKLKQPAIPYYGLYFLDHSIGYIKLDHFLYQSSDAFENAFLDLKEKGIQKLIIDIRNSTGGMVRETHKIAGYFLEESSLILYYIGQQNKVIGQEVTKNKPIDLEIPLVILTNNETISAGEIFAGAMQDHDRAILAGTPTKGKGLVQSNRMVTDSTALYFTVAYYLTPAGRSIHNLTYGSDYVGINKNNIELKPNIESLQVHKPLSTGKGIVPDTILRLEEVKTNFETQIIGSLKESKLLFWWALEWARKENVTSKNITVDYQITPNVIQSFIKYYKQHDSYWEVDKAIDLNTLQEIGILSKNWSSKLIKKRIVFLKENENLSDILKEKIVDILLGSKGLFELKLRKDEVVNQAIDLF